MYNTKKKFPIFFKQKKYYYIEKYKIQKIYFFSITMTESFCIQYKIVHSFVPYKLQNNKNNNILNLGNDSYEKK